MSETAMFLSDKDDGLGDIRAILKEEMGKHHAEHINKMLTGDKGTAAGNNFESLDRVTVGASASANEDMYSIDRSANSWSLAEHNENSGTDRNLSLDQLDDLFQKIWTRGGNPKVILTGYDTLMHDFSNSSKANNGSWKRSELLLPTTVSKVFPVLRLVSSWLPTTVSQSSLPRMYKLTP